MRDLQEEHIRNAAKAHTTLTVFGAVQALLEGGTIHGGNEGGGRTALRIIKLCETEMQRQLKRYDKHFAAARKQGGA
ncbi:MULTISPECIES: hypothetical protein [unclassified Acidovorax]|uniref:hypothetical protein n=1 Tax=unclassified Acidovorax TaxID=2684926 RepID=UPI001C47135C|nr:MULTISPECIES: hypothetical protein [unclassified Acidovorax]MBV7459450.1 hypothetical protein [Acidovorax sp. sif0632]MBV7464475.1 hypothetical protein [Acidovorax sp. sif0613]